jgi:hypothetical protein
MVVLLCFCCCWRATRAHIRGCTAFAARTSFNDWNFSVLATLIVGVSFSCSIPVRRVNHQPSLVLTSARLLVILYFHKQE